MTALHTGRDLTLRAIGKEYRSAGVGVRVLSDVDLSVREGEFVSLLGTSGCGKSTLLRLIAGLDHPSEGEIHLGEQRVEAPDRRRGLVFQDPNLFPWLTVRDNIAFGPSLAGGRHRALARIDELVRLVGLDGFADAYPHQLSGGMAQRAALARTLINDPEILLLDEPLGALDSFTRMEMQDEILRVWQARKTTVVMVTHDIDEALLLSDRVVLMTPRPGRVQDIVDVALPRPRERNSPEFFHLRSRILEAFHFARHLDNSVEPFL